MLFPTPEEYVFYTRPDAPRLDYRGEHRTWTLVERQGTATEDKFTLLSSPIPGALNPSATYEDGQYPDMNTAYESLLTAERLDDGTHTGI